MKLPVCATDSRVLATTISWEKDILENTIHEKMSKSSMVSYMIHSFIWYYEVDFKPNSTP